MGKWASFYFVRSVLAAASAGAEALLYSAVRGNASLGPAVANVLLAVLVPATGLFVASSGAVVAGIFVCAIQ